jgi:carbonic anhydrase/acetyltransferase-like protein (isoleucine patch superfamily)
MVDRAVVEQNAAVSAYGYVGPGVRIRSGFVVLPGKAVRTQAEADDPALGKVAPLTEADFEGTALSLAANTGFARDYSRLYRDDPRAVRGIGSSPGGSAFSPERVLPVVGAEPGTCDGTPAQAAGFRGRIIGPVCLEDSLRRLSRVTGERVSLRNDEGGGVPWTVGHLGHVDDQTVFHNVPGAGISVGDGVAFGVRSSLHVGPGRGVTVGDGAVIGADSTVFGSTVGEGARIGSCSLVGFADVADGQVVGDNQIVFGDEVFGTVEWACRR